MSDDKKAKPALSFSLDDPPEAGPSAEKTERRQLEGDPSLFSPLARQSAPSPSSAQSVPQDKPATRQAAPPPLPAAGDETSSLDVLQAALNASEQLNKKEETAKKEDAPQEELGEMLQLPVQEASEWTQYRQGTLLLYSALALVTSPLLGLTSILYCAAGLVAAWAGYGILHLHRKLWESNKAADLIAGVLTGTLLWSSAFSGWIHLKIVHLLRLARVPGYVATLLLFFIVAYALINKITTKKDEPQAPPAPIEEVVSPPPSTAIPAVQEAVDQLKTDQEERLQDIEESGVLNPPKPTQETAPALPEPIPETGPPPPAAPRPEPVVEKPAETPEPELPPAVEPGPVIPPDPGPRAAPVSLSSLSPDWEEAREQIQVTGIMKSGRGHVVLLGKNIYREGDQLAVEMNGKSYTFQVKRIDKFDAVFTPLPPAHSIEKKP